MGACMFADARVRGCMHEARVLLRDRVSLSVRLSVRLSVLEASLGS